MHRSEKGATILENKLDRIVAEELRGEVQRRTDKNITLKVCKKAIDDKRKTLEKESRTLGDKITRIEAAEFDIYQKYCIGTYSRNDYITRRDKYEAKLRDCKRQMDDLRERIDRVNKDMDNHLTTIKSMYRINGKRELTEELLHLLVSRIDVYPKEGIVIKWRFTEILKGAGL